MERDITRPHFVMRGIRSNRRGFEERPVFGGDTETYNGLPLTVQVWGPGVEVVRRVNSRTVTEVFLQILWESVEENARVYFHNLDFDLPVLFYPFLDAFQHTRFDLGNRHFGAEILCGKVNHATVWVKVGKVRKAWELVDSFAFFKAPLHNLSETFDLPRKLPKPKGLGRDRFQGPKWAAFKRYAIRDAWTGRELGVKIEDFHRAYDVRPTISGPQLAATIFRHRYIPKGKSIPANPRDCDEAAVLSYHGGKNGMYVAPGIYEGVKVYDINSAYPWAMANLPNPLDCSYVYDDLSRVKHPVLYPGIYCIDGTSESLTYNLVRDHAFRPVIGDVEGLWLTSYELAVALKAGFFHVRRWRESYTVNEHPRADYHPLREFSEDFFKLKSREKGSVREFYKVTLNSLYGKFIQNVEDDTPLLQGQEGGTLRDSVVSYKAGGLWNPLIASLITGMVRAHLTGLERRYESLHSSTDSIMTRKVAPTGKGLGDLSLKTEGTALLLRPKLYLLWNAEREVTAFALHGFHGSLKQFVRMMRSGSRTYPHFRMRRVKESFRDKVRPLTFVKFWKTLNLSVVGPLAIPALTYKGERL